MAGAVVPSVANAFKVVEFRERVTLFIREALPLVDGVMLEKLRNPDTTCCATTAILSSWMLSPNSAVDGGFTRRTY